ncbi:MAG: hypothetical protein Q4A00_05380 [Flavobacteriaceae bacterium]|nr:hypothetical protein [Flavobacteriaceae bacterium]
MKSYKMTNLDYFNYCKENPEKILDPYYKKGVLVIPENSDRQNNLTEQNARLINLITTFETLKSFGKTKENEDILKIIQEVINILIQTQNINYSAFCQFFMVYNSSFSVFKSMKKEEKFDFIYEMLCNYIRERHHIYLSHGYSNSILQVMSDNYSHKRNSKSGIEKVENLFSLYNIRKISYFEELLKEDKVYFLPDKGAKEIFKKFLEHFNLKMESRKIEHNKLPDLVIKSNENYYIFELKTMKEGGGGQNKQVVEFAYFIRFSEEDENVHYITFLDSLYSNVLFQDKSPKIQEQRNSVETALKENPNNYFLNTNGLKLFFKNNLK